MKMVLAVIQPFKLDEVVLALEEFPVPPGVTVSDAHGYDQEHALGEHDREEELTDFRPCVRVEIAVEDEYVMPVVRALRSAAHTGRRGDGRVWVQPVEATYSIRWLEDRDSDPEPEP